MTRRAKGFTLIELLFVVTLIGIMIAIAVPSFASFIANYRATAATNDLLQALTLTRAEALKRGKRVTLAPISGDFSKGWTVFIDTGTVVPPVWASPEELIFRHDALATSTTVAAPTGGNGIFGSANYVAYDGTGYPHTASTAAGALGGITVTDATGSKTSSRTLCLAVLGRPRIVQGATESCASN